ncbi:sensor histidine kinase [Nocardiopsis ansamitocini]|uniref:histidine kinase n=1 Tax=Nocardiopsis ansamitocini TaxID=1670832 RepID=A0A9W6P5J9_9ACTN|nr:histidine kinase [Nocardiopsis ansamitocini]GLU47546.1 hypothetical protein Nans01_18970 [Nocardiopsis ansamitocini]
MPAAIGDAEASAPARRPWVERLVAVLHLLTSLVLALLYLAPGALLLIGVNELTNEVLSVLAGDPEAQERLPSTIVASGIVPLPLVTLLARLACWVQRSRLEAVFGVVEAVPLAPGARGGLPVRVLRYLFGRDAWSAVLYSTTAGIVGLASGALAMALVAYGLGSVIGGLLGVVLALADGGLTELLDSADLAFLAAVAILLGPVSVLAGLWVAPWLVRADVGIARRMLFDSSQVRIERRMRELSDSRSRMVDAAEAERRRIERDLHDGAQQRLLAVTMTLTRARAKFDRDPETARALLAEAQAEAREVMAELREVARGLHPRVLTDHGLEAALPVAAGRCPVPVRVDADLGGRPSQRAEGIAYYAACEALTNIAKHAAARTVTVRAVRIVQRKGDLLRLTVVDDGIGGADPEVGTGLYGLWDRVHAVDGHLAVHSPTGGGTVLTADIPWEA